MDIYTLSAGDSEYEIASKPSDNNVSSYLHYPKFT